MVNAAFKVLDPTGDGVITTETLQRAVSDLGVKISEDEIKSMVKEADPEGKGTIDFQGSHFFYYIPNQFCNMFACFFTYQTYIL